MTLRDMFIQPYQQGNLIEVQTEGLLAFVIEPTGTIDQQRRWLWLASCWHAAPQQAFKNQPDTDSDKIITHEYYVKKALAAGFHVAGVDVGVTLGSTAGTSACQRFYETVVGQYRLHDKASLIAQSNGGLIMYNWASTYPQGVARIFGIFPVMDLRSWPGLKNVPSDQMITYPQLRHRITLKELEKRLAEFNPIDRLKPLAESGVSIMHVHGEQDQTVPFEPNSGRARQLYEALGGDIKIIKVDGAGHMGGPEFYESATAIDFLMG